MFHVHFFENKNLLLSQLLTHVPSIDENLKIKGKKAKVTDVINVSENHIHVEVLLEKVNKNKLSVDPSKKKKR